MPLGRFKQPGQTPASLYFPWPSRDDDAERCGTPAKCAISLLCPAHIAGRMPAYSNHLATPTTAPLPKKSHRFPQQSSHLRAHGVKATIPAISRQARWPPTRLPALPRTLDCDDLGSLPCRHMRQPTVHIRACPVGRIRFGTHAYVYYTGRHAAAPCMFIQRPGSGIACQALPGARHHCCGVAHKYATAP
jgi:hypothetical protein